MRQIIPYLKPYWRSMTAGLMIKIAGTFADLGLPYILAYILDDIIPKKKVSLILLWGSCMIFLSVLARTFNIIANRMASKVARNSVEKLRHDLFEKIFRLSGAQTDAFSVPSLISRITSDTYNIHQMIGMMQRLGVRTPIIFLGGIIITFTLEPVLTMVLVGVLPFLVFVMVKISRKGVPLYSEVQRSVDTMVRTIRETVNGIRVVKALSKTEYEKKRFSAVNERLSGKEIKAGSIMAVTGPFVNLLLNLALTFVIIVGAYRVNSGAILPGKIVAFLSYCIMILIAVTMINHIFVAYSKASASAIRIGEILSAEEQLEVKRSAKAEVSAEEGYIVFEHVSFGYHENKNCLHDINFKIKKGEFLGIIGATGSGKTTMINLLMRFYDVNEGGIYVNGRNVKSYEPSELRKKFGTVFQDDVIFSDSIYENISFGRGLSADEVEFAAKNGQAASFIAEKTGGYEYKASIKGADFSGGQKQRILISRALAGQPDILILDDSSSALDYKTDANLRKAIQEGYEGAAVIMVAQRVSSVMHMHHILVLEDGKMLGYGTHEELLSGCDVYKEIYQSQMGYEVEHG